MRKILFRAKDEATGKWIYGYPVINDKGSLFMFEENSKEHNRYSCIKTTLGQYTSLNDKIGRRIFEGDIVRYKNNSPCKIEYIDCQFVMMWEKFYLNFEDVYDHEIEVIGNIHDNPELLTNNL